MTNEELIKKIETQIDFEKKSESEYNIGRRDAYTNVLILFKQLEEPTMIASKNEQIIIPKFVADWIEENKSKFSILDVAAIVRTEGLVNQKVDDWICKNDEMFVRAWIDDNYTIEKEPEKLYRVKFPNVTKHGNETYLYKNDGEDVTSIDWSPKDFVENDDSDDYHFTEQEIKAIDERYWIFREEVEV